MPVEFLGWWASSRPSPTLRCISSAARLTRAHKNSDFDGVLVGYTSGSADGLHVPQAAAAYSERIKFLIAHRPGFVAQTLAARMFSTLDFFTGGHDDHLTALRCTLEHTTHTDASHSTPKASDKKLPGRTPRSQPRRQAG